MKKIKLNVLVVSLAAIVLSGCNESGESRESVSESTPASESVVSLETTEDKISYLMAYAASQQAAGANISLNPEIMQLAISDVENGLVSRISEDEARIVSSNFQRALQENRLESIKAANVAEGDAFRSKNAQRDEVIQTASGLQYEVLSSGGEGAKKPTREDSVKVHYHGTLINGKVFDSSVEAGEPVVFGVTQVIQGWTEVLQLMSEGDKWKVVVPSELAYPSGTRDIQPGSTLIFEIELLEVI